MPTKNGKKLTEEETREKRHQAGLKGVETRRRNKRTELRKQKIAEDKRKATETHKAEEVRAAEAPKAEAKKAKDGPKQNWFSQNLFALILIVVLVLVVAAWAIQSARTHVQPPTAVVLPTAVPPAAPTGNADNSLPIAGTFTFAVPGHLDTMPKTSIELAAANTWFHRVFNERLFNQANNWGGADSWFVTLNLGPNSGGNWTSMGNPGQIVYRGTSTHIQWDLSVLTSSQWKTQFMGDANMPAAINVRIAPESVVTVVTASGKTIQQTTSDMGDITIILPDSGVVTISVDYSTAAPTHESLVWWGPYDRSANINTVDAR